MLTNLRYPLQVSNGKLITTTDYPTIVADAIKSAIHTELEERVMQPDYGISNPVFTMGDTVRILSNVREAIQQGIKYYPDVSFQLYAEMTDNGALVIDVEYQIGINAYSVTV